MKKRLISLTVIVFMLCTLSVPVFAQTMYCERCDSLTTWHTLRVEDYVNCGTRYCNNCKAYRKFYQLYFTNNLFCTCGNEKAGTPVYFGDHCSVCHY